MHPEEAYIVYCPHKSYAHCTVQLLCCLYLAFPIIILERHVTDIYAFRGHSVMDNDKVSYTKIINYDMKFRSVGYIMYGTLIFSLLRKL